MRRQVPEVVLTGTLVEHEVEMVDEVTETSFTRGVNPREFDGDLKQAIRQLEDVVGIPAKSTGDIDLVDERDRLASECVKRYRRNALCKRSSRAIARIRGCKDSFCSSVASTSRLSGANSSSSTISVCSTTCPSSAMCPAMCLDEFQRRRQAVLFLGIGTVFDATRSPRREASQHRRRCKEAGDDGFPKLGDFGGFNRRLNACGPSDRALR